MAQAKTRASDDEFPDLLGPDTLSESSRKLRQIVLDEGWNYHERDLLVAESFHATEGEPFREIRVAKAIAHLMAEMPIRIREGEILVGWHPNTRADGDRAEELQEAREYLGRENYRTFCSEGHMAPDYPTTLASGLDGVLARIDGAALTLDPEEPETARKRVFYEAARISMVGFQHFIERYAELAATMAGEADDPDWADELREISRVCERIAHDSARNTREALQLSWFMFLGSALENSTHHHCFGPGRIDQWLHPYLLAERGAGDLSETLLDDLLAQYLIKCNEFSGPSMSAVILVIGGRKPDRSDATNELSFKILEIADRVRMYFPGIDVSWHSDMDREFVRRCVALLRNENG